MYLHIAKPHALWFTFLYTVVVLGGFFSPEKESPQLKIQKKTIQRGLDENNNAKKVHWPPEPLNVQTGFNINTSFLKSRYKANKKETKQRQSERDSVSIFDTTFKLTPPFGSLRGSVLLF